MKKKAAEEVVMGLKSIAEVSREIDVTSTNICRWVTRFGPEVINARTKDTLPLPIMKKPQKNKDDDLGKRVEELEEENIRLRKSLLESELRTQALNTMIDLAEENYGISLRKNSGAKQSSE
jgi:transposase-like protein